MALLPLFLLGCNEEPTRSVSYYKQDTNYGEREAKVAECRDNPGALKDTPNCINALEAEKEFEHYRRVYDDMVKKSR